MIFDRVQTVKILFILVKTSILSPIDIMKKFMLLQLK